MRGFKFLVFTALLAMLLSMNVLAAEQEGGEDAAVMTCRASNARTGEVEKSFTISYKFVPGDGITRYVDFTIDCRFTAEWDEGYGGYISEAVFGYPANIFVDGQPGTMTKNFTTSQKRGDIYYMEYKINNQEGFIMIVEVCCDEWGDVDLRAKIEFRYPLKQQ